MACSVCYRVSMATGKCSADGCGNEGRLARGWCQACYAWSRNHDWTDPSTRKRRHRSLPDGECTVVVDGVKCTEPYQGNGMCVNHNRNRRVHGDPLKLTRLANGVSRKRLEAAAYSDLIVCIPFHRGTANSSVWLGEGQRASASRAVWILRYGDPGELFVLHKCNGGSGANGCININHLYLGDNSRNMIDRSEALRQVVEDHHNAKLTNGDALSILDRHHNGERVGSLAAEYGVSGPTISDLISGRTWSRLPGR